MCKPSESPRPRGLIALSGAAVAAVAALFLQVPLGAAAGVAPGGAIAAEPVAPAAVASPAPAATPKADGSYRLRCWQYGKLLFDEGPVKLGADARLGAKLVATDRAGAALLVTDAGSATCLAQPR